MQHELAPRHLPARAGNTKAISGRCGIGRALSTNGKIQGAAMSRALVRSKTESVMELRSAGQIDSLLVRMSCRRLSRHTASIADALIASPVLRLKQA